MTENIFSCTFINLLCKCNLLDAIYVHHVLPPDDVFVLLHYHSSNVEARFDIIF